MDILYCITILIILFVVETIYFKLADRYGIVDKPNHRSSHTHTTIRGGGIIFPLAILIFFFFYGFYFPYFITGLLLIAFISFIDDIFILSSKLRLIIQFASVALMLTELQLFSMPWLILTLGTILIIGTINSYNFMDGINGITGAYSLCIIATLLYINEFVVLYTSSQMLIFVLLALIVFNFFNFRIRAKCFAGDVGSISISFIIVFVIGQLILKTGNFSYILFMLVYGFDTFTTILFRLARKENISEAHRTHLYQRLANEKGLSHLKIAFVYAIIQLAINAIILFVFKGSTLPMIIFVFVLGIGFIYLRFLIEGKTLLLNKAKS